MVPIQRILVFQQRGSGEKKIRGIRQYGGEIFRLDVISVDEPLPELLEDTTPYLPSIIEADLVLDFLTHPDLSHDLARRCRQLGIPVVASGKKGPADFTPVTCCALSRNSTLGRYGEKFGAPQLTVTVENGTIEQVEVLRGAPCGATWEAARALKDCPVEEAPVRLGLKTQMFCVADPSGWDPISGKSPVHIAGELHRAALKVAIEKYLAIDEKPGTFTSNQ